MHPRVPLLAALSALAIMAAGCGTGGGAGSALSPAANTMSAAASGKSANALMQSQTVKSVAPSAIGVPPMAATTVQSAAAMTSRTPQSQITGLGWTQLPGVAQSGAASPDGSLWVVSNASGGPGGDTIWHYVNGSWTQIPGAATRVTVGPDGTLWALTLQGAIYTYKNGTWSTIVGGASDIAIGSDGSVYVVSNDSCCAGGSSVWHYANGVWTQLPGAGVRIAASWDSGTFPGGITPGGFYLTTLQNTIYYYSPSIGYSQVPGAAVQVAPTTSGGIFVLGNDASPQKSIWYRDLSGGSWTEESGAGASLMVAGSNVYVIASNGGIWVSPIIVGAPPATLTGTYLGTTSDSFAGLGYVGVNIVQSGASLSGTWGVLYASAVAAGPLTGTVNGTGVSMTFTTPVAGFCPLVLTGTVPSSGQVTSWTGGYSGTNCSAGSFSLALASSLPNFAGTYNNGTATGPILSGALKAMISQTAGGALSGNYSLTATNPANSGSGTLTGMVVRSNAAVFYLVPNGVGLCPFGAAAIAGSPITGQYSTIAGTCSTSTNGSFTLQ